MRLFQPLILGITFSIVSCGGTEDQSTRPSEGTTGGVTGVNLTGGSGSDDTVNPTTSRGGNGATGGNSSHSAGGKSSTGGKSTIGSAATGGAATGGAATGGAATGGAATGGKSATGGAATGGKSATGGAATGGKSATGGAATGGAATGGAATGGAATGGATNTCMAGPHTTPGTTYNALGSGNVAGGYHYEYWSDESGLASMTVFDQDATFKASWNNVGDFLARVGLKFNSTKTYDQYGTISADFAHLKSGTGPCYVGVYGWTQNPPVEYYIIEDWNGGRPNMYSLGTFTVDGGRYDVYHETQQGDPSTLHRYYSVRKTARQCGHVTITEHFKQWTALGANLGKLYDAKLFVEAFGGGSGTVEFTVGTVTVQ